MTTPRTVDYQTSGLEGEGSNQKNFAAVSALILGLVSLIALIFFRPLAFVPAIAGIVVGLFALRSPVQRWIAVIGIILCILTLLGVLGVVKILLGN